MLIKLLSAPRRLLARAIRKVLRQMWAARAKIERRYGSALISRPGVVITSCVVWPWARKRIYFNNVRKGEFIFELHHSDALLAKSRKSIVARFGLTESPWRPATEREIGLPKGEDGRSFSYMGLGKPRDEGFSQNVAIKIPAYQKWMYVELEVRLDRVINLDRLRLKKRSIAHNPELTIEVTNWVRRTPEATDAIFLLYADIDLNVVDGSSVWLSSMASILCHLGRCILVSKVEPKSQVVISNIQCSDNLLLLSPAELSQCGDVLDVQEACQILGDLDDILPTIRFAVLRGTDAAATLLATRQFRNRSIIYLTDFYELTKQGLTVTPERKVQAGLVVTQAAAVLTQTSEIGRKLSDISGVEFKAQALPPAIPDEVPSVEKVWLRKGRKTVRIGYAGKITPDWGIIELFDWTEQAIKAGHRIELHIVANKISESASQGKVEGFAVWVSEQMRQLNAIHHQNFNREQSMALMAKLDYVWCWRPGRLEKHTLELSTKLVEMVASGARCLCYPNAINRKFLGEEYPFFLQDFTDFRRLLLDKSSPPPDLSERVRAKHALTPTRKRLGEVFISSRPSVVRRICFSGHDMKFIHPYMSYLKHAGHEIVRDEWAWGEGVDLVRTQAQHEWAEIVFCEWGLANAVWHSRNRMPGKRVFVRAHLQEIGERARKFGFAIDVDNVERIIFVSSRVRDEAVKLFSWPKDKTLVIPNYVLDDEFQFKHRSFDGVIRLGMVGVIPQRKRLDRAVDLLAELQRRGHEARLAIKGPRPETLGYMHAPGRRAELDYYKAIYDRLNEDKALSGSVSFYPWGNDMPAWYRGIDHILSPSDFESFHYALADGVLSGCHPLIWPWEEAETLYSHDWIVSDVVAAADRIGTFQRLSPEDQEMQLSANRKLVVDRYGREAVFSALNAALNIGEA